ncbi:HAD domain-containing protein [Methanobrevibacter filiformis]|uniref:5' nucleotidase, deoxy (Pyrimidine), cytosolic type C protein n=1 Tax=Methanobrevibacter filiformis TaxID=55758 RepID=A0A166EI16_9EURY|nr:HAD domain-containing protein [Methanobrevibacter filiformis]KZX16676.1 hypothetical protein MBFIL_04840 [Methanobrevibacter filiformis]
MKKIIFLDIDGVLQPTYSENRFDYVDDENISKLYKNLLKEKSIDYSIYDKYDVAAVYYDWNKEAVSELKRIIETTNAKIVISSDWRIFGDIQRLIDLFEIHNLGKYIIDITPNWDYEESENIKKHYEEKLINEDGSIGFITSRELEILEYMRNNNNEIEEYVAIDDLTIDKILKEHFVETSPYLTKEDADKCIKILNGIY